jgi:hypothetical protein
MALHGSDYMIIERAGAVYHVLGSDILAYIEENLGTSQFQVADITARNALTGLSVGDKVFVEDASADATITAGWAIYRWLGLAWAKIAEQEALDVKFQLHDEVTLTGTVNTSPLTIYGQQIGFSISQLSAAP